MLLDDHGLLRRVRFFGDVLEFHSPHSCLSPIVVELIVLQVALHVVELLAIAILPLLAVGIVGLHLVHGGETHVLLPCLVVFERCPMTRKAATRLDRAAAAGARRRSLAAAAGGGTRATLPPAGQWHGVDHKLPRGAGRRGAFRRWGRRRRRRWLPHLAGSSRGVTFNATGILVGFRRRRGSLVRPLRHRLRLREPRHHLLVPRAARAAEP
mmetsp:Transcript_75781/g.220085  ORF Transcript_75781/g.220085 Transcript_75781/m.220085 type:complete len:211 (-) Transcript_75781:717-1349(-)